MTVSENAINATTRTVGGSSASRRLRKQDGMIPAIVYSLGKENLKIAFDAKEWAIFAKKDIQVIKLEIDKEKILNVLLKDIQYNVLSNSTLHVDLQEIDMKEKITAAIKINYVGEAPAVKEQGGVLIKNLDEIEVKCLPQDLISEIEVKINILENIDDIVYVKDLNFPENLEVQNKPDEPVVSVVPPAKEEEEKPPVVEGEEGEEGEAVEGEEGEPASAEASAGEGDKTPEGEKITEKAPDQKQGKEKKDK